VQGIIRAGGDQAVRLDHHRHVGGLERELDLLKAQIFKQGDAAQGAFIQGPGRNAVFGQQILLQRTGVDADPDGGLMFFGRPDNLGNPLFRHIARIDPDAVRAVFDGVDGQLRVEMNIGNQRNGYPFFDVRKRPDRVGVGNRHPGDFATRAFQRINLGHRRGDVARVRIGHGLDGNRFVSPDPDGPDPDDSALSSEY